MKNFISCILLLLLITSCESSDSSNEGSDLRLIGHQFALGMTHNSHLGRGYPTPESSYSATITFELFLSEETDHEDIYAFRIIDTENSGWTFNTEEVQSAYNEDNHSLIFYDLELRVFDSINGKLVKAQFIDENEAVIRERGFTLDNDFPLPALTNSQVESGSQLQIFIDFYNTPYDGGTIPFPVTIYNTFYSSNTFVVTWLNANEETVRQDFFGTNVLTEYATDDWRLDIPLENIPDGTSYYYTTFLRGWYTVGGVLYTRIDELPGEIQQK